MKFWNFYNLETGAEMRLEGPISEDTWWGDVVTPALFKDELKQYDGKDLTIWINSPGGDVFAASVIYTAIRERRGNTKVKIDGMAASAASVIAMAGDTIEMSPTSILMVHNPITGIWGDENDMKHVIKVLKEVKETIINAYEMKTKLSREKLSALMDAETWMNAHEAVRLGFADSILYEETAKDETPRAMAFDSHKYSAQICARIKDSEQIDANTEDETNALESPSEPSTTTEPEFNAEAVLELLNFLEGL